MGALCLIVDVMFTSLLAVNTTIPLSVVNLTILENAILHEFFGIFICFGVDLGSITYGNNKA
jgi:uncharacterized membrane protein (DUF441 family)